jgi:hypothetical protein
MSKIVGYTPTAKCFENTDLKLLAIAQDDHRTTVAGTIVRQCRVSSVALKTAIMAIY